MRDLDVGMLPVLEENQLVGTITDRDITVRATATGASPDEIPVGNVMSRGVIFGYEDDDADAAAATMEEAGSSPPRARSRRQVRGCRLNRRPSPPRLEPCALG